MLLHPDIAVGSGFACCFNRLHSAKTNARETLGISVGAACSLGERRVGPERLSLARPRTNGAARDRRRRAVH